MKAIGAVAVLVAGFVVVAVLLSRPPDPAPLPDGASPLAVRTQPPVWRIPGLSGGCSLAELRPMALVRDGEAIALQAAEGGEPVPVVFPYGFSARLVGDRAELVSPDGNVIAREGDVISGLMGASASNGDFILCFDAATRLRVDHGD